MNHRDHIQPDFGTGRKNLAVYTTGFIACMILTVIAFGAVMSDQFSRMTTFAIIFIVALIQFLIQVVCFLRLNVETHQGKMNVMSFVFTIVILLTIVAGSLWIMYNLNYYMLH